MFATCAWVQDAEEAAGNSEALDRDLTAENLDRGLACIGRINRRLVLPIDGNALEFRLYQNILPTGPVHRNDIPRFQATEFRPTAAPVLQSTFTVAARVCVTAVSPRARKAMLVTILT